LAAAQQNIPLVSEWKVLRNGALQGLVKNHPTISNGDVITTSPLVDRSPKNNQVVVTKTGSKYRLGKGVAVPVAKANGASAPKPAVAAKKKAVAQPASPKSTAAAAAAATVKKTAATKEQQQQQQPKSLKERLQQAKTEYGLNGKTIGDGKYLLVGQLIRSTSMRSQIYYAYKADKDGLPTGPRLTVKISTNLESLERENRNYDIVTRGLFSSGKFVRKLEFLPEANGSPRGTFGKSPCALVLESGERNLRALCDARKNQGFEGKAMRQAAVALAQCLQAMHSSGLVWTDLKAENFVVISDSLGDGSVEQIKGIDLESAVPAGGPPEDYSPEACPPEFAKVFLDGRGLDFKVQYNYDMWSFGMLLYELAVGKAFFAGKRDNQITKLLNEKGFEADVSAVPDERLRDLIAQCLQVEPKKRPGITQALLHPYFLTTGFGPISF
jgi:serine/threonine protein kinase